MEENLRLTLVQTSLHWEDRDANLGMLDKKLEDISPGNVVLLPEMFSTGFSMNPAALAEDMNGATVQWMKKTAKEKKIILGGSIIIREGDDFYNRFVWMLPNGQYGIYDKRHLFGYAGEDEKYSAGNKMQIASVNGWKLKLLVCYDLRFPVWARQQVKEDKPEYDVLVYVANWPERRIHAWKILLQARAIENQCYVAGVNRVGTDGNDIHYSGDSMIVDPMGEVLATRTNVEEIFTVELDRKQLEAVREKLPFLKDADEFQIRNSIPGN